MANVVYRGYKEDLTRGLDWSDLTLRGAAIVARCLLVEVVATTAGADEDPDFQFLSAALGVAGVAEMVATNYARQTLATPTNTYDAAGNRMLLDIADPVFPNLGVADGTDGTVRYALLYRRVGADDTTPADDPLWAKLDIPDTVTNGQNFTIAINASGLFAVGG